MTKSNTVYQRQYTGKLLYIESVRLPRRPVILLDPKVES